MTRLRHEMCPSCHWIVMNPLLKIENQVWLADCPALAFVSWSLHSRLNRISKSSVKAWPACLVSSLTEVRSQFVVFFLSGGNRPPPPCYLSESREEVSEK